MLHTQAVTHLSRVPLHDGATVEEIDRHLAPLLYDNLRQEFAGRLDRLAILVWCEIGARRFDFAEEPGLDQFVLSTPGVGAVCVGDA
jgi:hypothetical protein